MAPLVEELELAGALEPTEELELLEELELTEEPELAEEPELTEEFELPEGTLSELFAVLHPVNISIAPTKIVDNNFFIMYLPFHIYNAAFQLPELSATNCVCAILTLLLLNLTLQYQNVKPIPTIRLATKKTTASHSGAPNPLD